MSFSGTQDKCNVCDKTVHFIDLLSVDAVIYHKTCFKCSHCKGTLSMCSYCSHDGVLYCKTHFEQLFKETGKYPVAQSGTRSSEKDLSRSPSKLSHMFTGTQDKCASCHKTAYPLEKLTLEGEIYHKTCFKCSHGGCTLTPSSYAAMDGILYCKHHFAQLFMEKGSYSHLKGASVKKGAAAAAETTAAPAPAEEEAAAEAAAPAEEEDLPEPELEHEAAAEGS